VPDAPETLARFDAVATSRPDAVAIVADDGVLSYAELAALSRSIAAELERAGVEPGDVVGLALGRTVRHVAAMLGAWRLRAAFLPLDAAAPAARVDAMLRESRARAVLRVDSTRVETRARSSPLGAAGDDLAYVVYTSGSTGVPKGVRVSHRGLFPVLGSQIEAFGLAPGKRALACLSFAFDASISDIGTSLASGATLFVAGAMPSPRGLSAELAARAITHVDLPPSFLARVDAAALPASLETVVIGGEPCPPAAVRAWARRVRVVNVYGPTEATICTSLCACDASAWDQPLLGEPLAHVRYRVEGGELWIGGPAVALGYVDRAELEARRFVVDERERWFKTGDRVGLGPGGALVFAGRVDRQIKVRGQLVAPEEIESALRAHASVVECAVTMSTLPGESRESLTAFVATRDGASVDLRAHLAASLPSWMLPRIVRTDALARGPFGKVDLGATRATSAREATIARAMQDALGVVSVALDDDFVALGGDSLAALEVAAHAELAGVEIEPSDVLTARTPRAVARVVRDPSRARADLEREAERLARELEAQPLEHGDFASAGDWLVTGATGFLGSRLVPDLLARTSGIVHCIVRAPSDERARARLGPLAADRRVVAHAGDVGLPRMGLTDRAWRELADSVRHVVHAAAVVNLALSYDALAQTNVRGAFEVARFVRHGARKSLVLVSSLAVLVSTDGALGAIDERTTLSPGARVFGGYAQTKTVAEALVKLAVPRARVVRPGLLTGDSVTGRGAPRCQLAAFLRGIARIGCVPACDAASLRVDVTPIDWAAHAIAAIATDERGPDLVHVASERGASLEDLLVALRARVTIDEADSDELVRRARAALPRDVAMALVSSSRRLLGRACHESADLFLMTDRTFATGRCPPPDAALLARYVDAALGGQT